MSGRNWMLAALAATAMLWMPGTAQAYSSTSRYAKDPMTGGGGGRFFTGAPGDSFTCGVCHGEDAGPKLKLAGAPKSGYEPGQQYEISIQWDPADQFEVLASIVYDDGSPAGTLALEPFEELSSHDKCAAGPVASEIIDDERFGRGVAAMIPCGAERLDLVWTAPEETGGCGSDAVLYIAGVAGDESEDPQGDTVSARVERWGLAGSGTSPECAAVAGCRVSGEWSGSPEFLFIIVVLGAAVRRGRRRE